MASIEEVAREAGVSITTASHVFSGKRPVAPDTRRRVVAVAERLDYRPHRAARGLATGRTMTIGLHFPFEGDSLVLNPSFPELLEGLSAAAAEAGYGFLLIPASLEARFPLELALKEGRFDGVIVADPTQDNALIPALLRRGVPLVTTGGRYLGSPRVPWVDDDRRGGLVQLMAHLEGQGYRRPALLSIKGGFSSVQDVEETFEKELRARGGEVTGGARRQPLRGAGVRACPAAAEPVAAPGRDRGRRRPPGARGAARRPRARPARAPRPRRRRRGRYRAGAPLPPAPDQHPRAPARARRGRHPVAAGHRRALHHSGESRPVRRAGRPRLHPPDPVPPQRPVAAAAGDRQPRRAVVDFPAQSGTSQTPPRMSSRPSSSLASRQAWSRRG